MLPPLPARQDLWMRIYSIGKKVSKAPMQQLETPAVAAKEGMLLLYMHEQTKMLNLHLIQCSVAITVLNRSHCIEDSHYRACDTVTGLHSKNFTLRTFFCGVLCNSHHAQERHTYKTHRKQCKMSST
jgi:hypothetical protein